MPCNCGALNTQYCVIAEYASYVMKDVPSWPKKYHIGLHFNPSKKAYYWQGPNRAEISVSSHFLCHTSRRPFEI